MKANLETIVIKLGTRKITLTADEARAMREQLNKLFGEPAPQVIHHHKTEIVREAPPIYTLPYRDPDPFPTRPIWAQPVITC